MKYLLSIILIFAVAVVQAQEQKYETVFTDINHYGWYGTITVNYANLNSRDALIIGGRGAWIIDHYLAIGGAGYGFINENEYNLNLSDENKYKLGGGYGGVLFVPILAPKSPVHLCFPLLIGAGGVSYSKVLFDNWTDEENKNIELASETFFVVEPGIELELNIIKILRLSFGMYYRFTSDIILETDIPFQPNSRLKLTDTDVLSNFSYGISLKIGRF